MPQALSRDELIQAVHDNLKRLGLDVLDVVNLRVGGLDTPTPGSIAEPFTVLAELQQQGLLRHLGISRVNAKQVSEPQSIAPIVSVQNFYNIANRADDSLLDSLAGQGIAFVSCTTAGRARARARPDGSGSGSVPCSISGPQSFGRMRQNG